MFMRGGIGNGNNAVDNLAVGVIPEPGTIALIGLGLMGLAGCGRRNRRTA